MNRRILQTIFLLLAVVNFNVATAVEQNSDNLLDELPMREAKTCLVIQSICMSTNA